MCLGRLFVFIEALKELLVLLHKGSEFAEWDADLPYFLSSDAISILRVSEVLEFED